MIGQRIADKGRQPEGFDLIGIVKQNRAISVKLVPTRKAAGVICDHMTLAMGENREAGRFMQPDAQSGCGFAMRRHIAGLAPAQHLGDTFGLRQRLGLRQDQIAQDQQSGLGRGVVAVEDGFDLWGHGLLCVERGDWHQA